MQQLEETVRQALLAMKEEDLAVRAKLIAEGTLAKEGYHPQMEAVHRSNAARLTGIIEQYGWPGKSLVGEEGAEAAWLIAQHAIGDPPFMRCCLSLLQQAGSRGEVPLWQAAMMEDRIRMFEGRPQVYGSQFQPDEHGEMVPYPIENPEEVDERRRAVGLIPLQEKWAELRKQAAQEKVPLPAYWREGYQAWLRRAGWRP